MYLYVSVYISLATYVCVLLCAVCVCNKQWIEAIAEPLQLVTTFDLVTDEFNHISTG